MRHFVTILPQPIRTREDLLPFEKLCTLTNIDQGISWIYKIFVTMAKSKVLPYIRKWENEIGTRVNKQQLGKIIKMVHSSAVGKNTIEMNYKYLTRWYITPDKEHKYQSGKSPYCWRCCKVVVNMFHIWFECPKIKKYWKEILEQIKEITNIKVLEDPWVYLFHGINSSLKQ